MFDMAYENVQELGIAAGQKDTNRMHYDPIDYAERRELKPKPECCCDCPI